MLTIVGAVALLGFLFGLGARRLRLPSLLGYLVLGVVLGPSVLQVVDVTAVHQLAFVTDIALGFVAFSIGTELDVTALRRLGSGIVAIILAESFGAFIVVALAIFALTRNLPMALIFGAMAPASAPAGTVAVIQECKAKGPLTKAVYAVVGFDDGLAILIFGFAAAAAKALLLRGSAAESVGLLSSMIAPVKEIGLSLLVGAVAGVIFSRVIRAVRDAGSILIIAFGFILVASGLSVQWHLSLILTNMVIGFVVANSLHPSMVSRIVAPLHQVMPLLFVLFFFLAGAHLKLSALPALGAVGVVYIIGRSIGLVGGARIGAAIGGASDNIRKYIGMSILSQAGVAIGLSLMVKQDFGAIAEAQGIPEAAMIASSAITVIAATSIVFEIVGPILTRIALQKAGEIPDATLQREPRASRPRGGDAPTSQAGQLDQT